MKTYFLILVSSIILFSCNQDPDIKTVEVLEAPVADAIVDSAANAVLAAKAIANESKAVVNDTNQMVQSIREEYARIGKYNLKKKSMKFHCKDNPEDLKVDYYLSNDNKVVKIAIDWGTAGDFSSFDEFYYKNNELIFIFKIISGGAANEKQTDLEQRTYVYEHNVIRYMEDKKIMPCNTCSYPEKSYEYRILKVYGTSNVESAFCDWD
jgi:uncharacterized protein YcfL